MKSFAGKQTSKRNSAPRRSTALPPVHTSPPLSIIHDIRNSFIQRRDLCPCDGGCPSCAPVPQTKLTVGKPGDQYEQEADRVADQVMRMPLENIQRQPMEEEEEMLMPKAKEGASVPMLQCQPMEEEEEMLQPKSNARGINPVSHRLSRDIAGLRKQGSPFFSSERNFFEQRFGHDFSDVRIHTGQKAADLANDLNARAFTIGNDVVFGSGEFTPTSQDGRTLIAHELTHVIQQSFPSGKQNLSEQLVQRGPPSTLGGAERSRDPARERRSPASSIGEYITLVRDLESYYPEMDPRQFLAMLRQIYYGRPWSARTTTQWSDVLPNSPAMSDPRHRAGRGEGSLFHAIRESQEMGGLDIGHVLTGLEALLNPTTEVTLTVTGPDPTVSMPNTEFATWGGDLGSAAGQSVADILLTRPRRPDREYFSEYASDADLEGNIDSFGIEQGARVSGGLAALLSAPPSGSMAGAVRGGTPVSQILSQYYTGVASDLSSAHTNRYSDFVNRIGGRVSGSRIVNRAALVGPIARRVASFAYLWFIREVRDERGRLSAAFEHYFPEEELDAHLNTKSRIMVNLFFNWLEARL